MEAELGVNGRQLELRYGRAAETQQVSNRRRSCPPKAPTPAPGPWTAARSPPAFLPALFVFLSSRYSWSWQWQGGAASQIRNHHASIICGRDQWFPLRVIAYVHECFLPLDSCSVGMVVPFFFSYK